MSTTKVTKESLLQVVSVTAGTVTSALSTVSNAMQMLDDTVSEMRKDQQREHEVNRAKHSLEYKLQAKREHSEFLMKINEFRAKSQLHEQMFDIASNALDAEILRQASPTT